jgi:hypothetical protein
MVIGTICAANHLPKAACLAKSLGETQPRHTFALCLVERDKSALDGLEAWFPEVILASETGITDPSSFMFRYERYEACRAVKARFLLWAMNRFPQEQNFLFLDPDVMTYSRFEELEALLPESEIFTRKQIIVTPHQLRDEDSSLGVRENTFRTLTAGTFNLGFLALRRSPTAVEILEWWDTKLQDFCYMEWRERGLFVDQKWALLGLSFFDMTVLREPGYNVANWNVSTRQIERDGENYLVNGRPLRFFHFSNMDYDRDLYHLRRFSDTSHPVFTLRGKYKEDIHSFGHSKFFQVPWSYDKYLSGAPISPEARFVYRSTPELWRVISNPFAEDPARFYSLWGPNSSSNEPAKKPNKSYSRFRNFFTRSFT